MQIIVTGGFFPITYMRNDIISSLISSFSIVGAAESKSEMSRFQRCDYSDQQQGIQG